MSSGNIRARLLWLILLLATFVLGAAVVYKLEIYPGFNNSIKSGTMEMGSILVLMFFLIFVVLYVPTGRLKKGERVQPLPTEVEVMPMDEKGDVSGDIIFVSADEPDYSHGTEIMEALVVEELE